MARSINKNNNLFQALECTQLDISKISMKDQKDELIVTMTFSGVKHDNIDLILENNSLHIIGYCEDVKETKKGNYSVKEMAYTNFERVIPLPVIVDESESHAEFKGNKLVVTLPKQTAGKRASKKIAKPAKTTKKTTRSTKTKSKASKSLSKEVQGNI